MRLQIVGFLICIMILITIPITAGVSIKNKQVCPIKNVFAKTTIRGIVLFPRVSRDGKSINFLAIRLHYRTIGPEGINYGIIKFHYFQIPKNFNGYFGNCYIFGTFRGRLNL
jgi:hypothetical protein